MYKAIKAIGGYKVGDEVPEDKALVWINMYAEPHIEKVQSCTAASPSPKKEEEASNPVNSILEDYLARNTSVVRKNISEDDLGEAQLKELLKLEKSGKKRKDIILAIKKRL